VEILLVYLLDERQKSRFTSRRDKTTLKQTGDSLGCILKLKSNGERCLGGEEIKRMFARI